MGVNIYLNVNKKKYIEKEEKYLQRSKSIQFKVKSNPVCWEGDTLTWNKKID